MLDWQTILVTLLILAAALYVARRGLSRLRSFRMGKKRSSSSSCETGCGCGGTEQAVEVHRKRLTRIGRARSSN